MKDSYMGRKFAKNVKDVKKIKEINRGLMHLKHKTPQVKSDD